MWIGVVTCLPGIVAAGLKEGVVGRAVANGSITIDVVDVRDYSTNTYGSIDDKPFGGAPGMLMEAEPLAQATERAVANAPSKKPVRVLLSPQGVRLNQRIVREFAELDGLVLICGRYEGIDERFIESHVDQEISIGDYVVSGGELPALIVIDAVSRLKEGTLGNAESASDDSFNDNLLEGPQYTRPQEWRGQSVPTVLTSGNHEDIAKWRQNQALLRTWQRRPDLLTNRQFTQQERKQLKHHIDERNQ